LGAKALRVSTRVSCDRRVRGKIGRWARVVVCAAAVALMGGCWGVREPSFRVAGVGITEETERATVLTFRVTGENTNSEELPLREVRYALDLDGRRVFSGTRSAEATLQRFGTQTIDLPATVLASNGGDALSGEVPYTLSGEVVYELPGTIAEVLFDARIRRPTAGFSQSGRLDFGALDRPIVGPEQ